MARREFVWNELREMRAQQIMAVISELRPYWPLTERQIHYQLVAKQTFWGGRRKPPIYPNTKSGVNDLSMLLKWMRLDDRVPWSAIEDRTRTVYHPRKFADVDEYVDEEIGFLLSDYKRCLVQGQPKYVQVWVEKEALMRIFSRICGGYCVSCKPCRGYDSITRLKEFEDLALDARERGQKPTVLYFGDLDPSGTNMLHAAIETLEEEFGLLGTDFKRVALNPNHVTEYDLPNNPDAGKKKDTRYKKYVERYGNVFVELDALHPEILETMLREAIEDNLDMEAFDEQKEVEVIDRKRIDHLKEEIVDLVDRRLGHSA
jgi:hypothetical protein